MIILRDVIITELLWYPSFLSFTTIVV